MNRRRMHRERLFAMRRIWNSANFIHATRRRRIDGGRPAPADRGTEIGGMIGAGLVEIQRNIASPPRPRTRAPFTFDRWIDTLGV